MFNENEWFGRFRDGRESVVDDVRSGRSFATRTDENIARVAALLKEDRQIQGRIWYKFSGGAKKFSLTVTL